MRKEIRGDVQQLQPLEMEAERPGNLKRVWEYVMG